jgi:hypothetical protein
MMTKSPKGGFVVIKREKKEEKYARIEEGDEQCCGNVKGYSKNTKWCY